MVKRKPVTQEISRIEENVFKRMFSEDPLVNIVENSTYFFRQKYHTGESLKILQIRYIPKNRIPTTILKGALLKEYVGSELFNRHVLKPVHIEDNHGGGDLGFVMLFDKPTRREKVSKIEMGIGFYESNTLQELSNNSQLWPWARGHIYVKFENGKPKTCLYFNGIESSPSDHALRGIALNLYRSVLDGVIREGGQNEGIIHHRYAEYDTPRIIDFGGKRLPYIM